MPGLRKREAVRQRKDEAVEGGTPAPEDVKEMRRKLERHALDVNRLNTEWRHSLTRVSVALAVFQGYRLYHGLRNDKERAGHFQSSLMDLFGVLLGLLLTDFIRIPRPTRPVSFYAAAAISLVEFALFVIEARKPGFKFQFDSSAPVGAFYFLFVWGASGIMARSSRDAKTGVEQTEKLDDLVKNQAKVH